MVSVVSRKGSSLVGFSHVLYRSFLVIIFCLAAATAEFGSVCVRCPRVLVTGAAGFIGFHVSRTLAARQQVTVVGIDNFNDYYDVGLKRERAYELSKDGVRMFHADVCDEAFLGELIRDFNVSCVIHLAAQAGVRYSVKEPHLYSANNIDCFVNLLEIVSQFRGVYLIYASTSSVYGPLSKVPFSIAQLLKRPGNVYSMTKQANERLAAVYCNVTGMRHVGLRFFTVYGAWGRPDMAAYKFADKILNGERVPVFHTNGSETVERDFTYVTDVVEGITAAMSYRPRRCGEVFNLGRGQPEPLTSLVPLLERILGIKAVVNELPLPPTELLQTYADISHSKQVLGYDPKISLEQGIKLFVDWLLEYRKSRQMEMQTSIPSRSHKYWTGLVEEQMLRKLRQKEEAVAKRVRKLKLHVSDIRQRFIQHANKNKISLPIIVKSDFIFYEGMTSPGYDLVKYPEMNSNTEMLMKLCQELDRCVAFTTDGTLKTRVVSIEAMIGSSRSDDSGLGLYIADIDVCAADLHSCSKTARCVSEDPGKYACICPADHWGDDCVSRLTSDIQYQKDISEVSENVEEWERLKRNAEFVFFEGVDSPGGDYLFADQYKGDNEALKQKCMENRYCLGFTTNGMLKSSVQWGTEWTATPISEGEGLFILDIDYCAWNGNDCPQLAHCERLGAGNYSCVCEPGLVMSTVQNSGRKSCLPLETATMSSYFGHRECCDQEVGEQCHIPDE